MKRKRAHRPATPVKDYKPGFFLEPVLRWFGRDWQPTISQGSGKAGIDPLVPKRGGWGDGAMGGMRPHPGRRPVFMEKPQ